MEGWDTVMGLLGFVSALCYLDCWTGIDRRRGLGKRSKSMGVD